MDWPTGTTQLCIIVIAVLTVGCSQIRTVTVQKEDPSIQRVIPDTLTLPELPPVEFEGGAETFPEKVVIYRDTVKHTVDLSYFEIDRSDMDDETVTVRTQRDTVVVEREVRLPVPGERLVGRADSSGLGFSVFGSPMGYEVEADVSTVEPPWWKSLFGRLHKFLYFAVGLVVGIVLAKLIPGI